MVQVSWNFLEELVWIIQKLIELRGRLNTAATSKMECFVIIVNVFQPLTIIAKRSILPLTIITKLSILDVAAVLDQSLKLTL